MLKILENLGEEDFEKFQWHLKQPGNHLEGLQPIPTSHLENADRMKTVDLMVQNYTSASEQILNNVLEEIGRNDLAAELFPSQRLEPSDLHNTPKGR